MSIEASSDLEELFRLNVTFDDSKGLIIETRSFSDRARRVRQATAVTKWRNTTFLGQGSSGVVRLQQEDEVPEKCRAIKEIRKGTLSAPLPVDYRRELLALGRLSKREDLFVRFLGWYEDNRSVYLAMEYFEQGDLDRHLSAPLPEDEVRVISKQLLEGLAVLHGQDWAHRDLKPPNIFVVDTSPWWVKIGDFGISKRIRSGNTRFQTMIGTPDFVAPEVLNLVSEVDDEDTGDEEDEYTVAVDMWSLGCVIFQLLTLETPFGANRKKLGSYCRSKLEKFPLIPLNQAAVSVAATEVIRGLLEPIPSHRTTADAALRCEWIHNVPASSDNDYGSQGTSHNSEAGRSPYAAADAEISSVARKAKENAEKSQESRSGPVNVEASNSKAARTLRRGLKHQEEVQISSLAYNSNKSEGSHILQTLSKPQATDSSSSYETVPKTNTEVEVKKEASPSSTAYPSGVAKDRSSEDGDGIPSISRVLDQQRRSISRNSKAPQFLLPPKSSSPLSKPPSLNKGSPHNVKVVSQGPKERPFTHNIPSSFFPTSTRKPKQQRTTEEQLKLTSNNSNHHRTVEATPPLESYNPQFGEETTDLSSISVYPLDERPLPFESYKPQFSEATIDLASASVYPLDEQQDPALARGFEKLSTTEQRPNPGHPVSKKHQTSFQTSFNIGVPRVPAPDLERQALRMAEQAARQKEMQETNESLYSGFGLEKQHMAYGSGQVEQAQTGSTPRVPPASFTNVPEDGQRKHEQPQSTGARKALLISSSINQQSELKNIECIKATADYLVCDLHYRSEDVVSLDGRDLGAPTRELSNAITWLLKAAKPGDSMLLQILGNAGFDQFFELLAHPIPKAARLTIIFEGYFYYENPLRLEYVYATTQSFSNSADQKRISRATHVIESTVPLSTGGAKWIQKSDGGIVRWWARESFFENEPLSKSLLAILNAHQKAQSTPTYNDILLSLDQSFEMNQKRVVLSSNHPIDFDSPFIL